MAFLSVATWESHCAARKLSITAERRWRNHAVVYFASIVIVAAVYRTGPILVAAAFESNRYGLLNKAWIPLTARWVLAFLLLDLVRYAEHRACHRLGFLWRLHQVHHSDPDVDVSTGFRHHPTELIVTQGIYLAVIAALAAPLGAVLIAELGSAFQMFFSHANARLPRWMERAIRGIWITPDVHRIHHSAEIAEQQSNFGDLFPWWDRLLGTYRAVPLAGQEGLIFGQKGLESARSLDVGFILGQPFLREAGMDRTTAVGYQKDQSL